jgi:hypothetical protein
MKFTFSNDEPIEPLPVSMPIHDAWIGQYMPLINERLDKLPPPFRMKVRPALASAELTFWSQPDVIENMPLLIVVGDQREFIRLPEYINGSAVVAFMCAVMSDYHAGTAYHVFVGADEI